MERELKQAVVDAAERIEVRRAVQHIYGELGNVIQSRRPICSASGRCCKFEEYGHRLYLTTMELANFYADVQGLATSADATVADRCTIDKTHVSLPVVGSRGTMPWNGRGCPYQIDGLCSVHAIRPFGCRIYFCDSSSTQWQHDQYEHFHGRLRALHDTLVVPYHYVEWRFALRALDLNPRDLNPSL